MSAAIKNSLRDHAVQRGQYGQQAQYGFTLLEMLIGLALLALMMVLVYSALHVGIRAWDAGDARVGEAAQQRIVQSFIRREFAQLFPVRWRGVPTSQIAFTGTKDEIRFVTALNLDAGLKDGGLQWAHLQLRDDVNADANTDARVGNSMSYSRRGKALYLTRESFDLQAKDWSGLDSVPDAQATKLLGGIASMEISYFGAENDLVDPQWMSEWNYPLRMPQLIKFSFKTDNGRDPPELIVQPKIGEEAGCYENNFQRQCGPRRA